MNITANVEHQQILSDILGPGIIIGYISLLVVTILVISKPSAFEGTANAMASVTMALGYSISSVIQTSRTQKGWDKDDDAMHLQDLAFAVCMTSVALAFTSVSLLSRGKIAVQFHDYYRPRQELYELRPRKVALLYVAVMVVAEVACCALSCYALQQLHSLEPTILDRNNVRVKNPFYKHTAILLGIQAGLIAYTVVASFSRRIQRHRWLTFWIACAACAPSLIYMVWAHACANVGVNFGDWSYGQTFNGAAGCASFAATWVAFLTDKESAVDQEEK